MRVTDVVIQWEDAQGIQVDIDISNEVDKYRLTVGGYSRDVDRY